MSDVIRSGIRYERWRDLAACRGADPDLFFPEPGRNTIKAKRICAACPVRVQCLEHAISHPERFGVFGGLDERERWGLSPEPEPRLCGAGLHEMTPANTKVTAGTGWERCRACQTASDRRTQPARGARRRQRQREQREQERAA